MATKIEQRKTGKETSSLRQVAEVMIAMSPAEQASIDGRALHKWLHDQTTLSGGVVMLTDCLHEIVAGTRVVILGIYAHLSSVADAVEVELVTTAVADGSGAVTEKSLPLHVETGAGFNSHDPQPFLLPVPVTVIREAGSLAVSVKATANDDSAIVTAGWFGYYETIAPDTDLDA